MTTDSWAKAEAHVIGELKRFSDEMREMRTEMREMRTESKEDCKLLNKEIEENNRVLNEKIDNLQRKETDNRINVAVLRAEVALIGIIAASLISLFFNLLTK